MRLYQLISKDWPASSSLAENMGTSPKNIERWLKQLKDEGKVDRHGFCETSR